ncbi:hypothetical protein BGZ89_010720 [Linnemannia elongata]|nr:hypothetical protein BGZ89_010720 [Linnemannia elongata]
MGECPLTLTKPKENEHALIHPLSSQALAKPQPGTPTSAFTAAPTINTDAASPSPHRVLRIPEPLAHIFAFLSPYIVIQYASLVCRDWLDVSRRFSPLPPVVATWSTHLTRQQISQRFLDTVTGASPDLVKLELFSLHLGWLNTETGKLDAEPVRRIASTLWNFVGTDEMDDFKSTFASVPNWSFSRDDFYNEGLINFLLPCQPTEIQMAGLRCLRGLEIHREGNHSGVHKALHAYLISPIAATLVHLKVMGANYPLSYFESGFMAPENWTCKGLQSLHLRSHHEIGILSPIGVSQGPANQWLSRHIFIGLTGTFLKMKDLRIDCPNVDFSLEGGMCLLRRMSDLERLRVKSMREGQFTERDLAWLLPDPTPEQRARNAKILAGIQDQIRIYRGGSSGRVISEKMSRGFRRGERDQSIAGTLEQVADLLEEIQTRGVTGRCLPYLESFIIEQGGHWLANTCGPQQARTREIVKRMQGSFFLHLTMDGAPPKLGVGP